MNTNNDSPAVGGDSFDKLKSDMQLWANRREGSAITFYNEAAHSDAIDMQTFVDRLQSLTSRHSAGAVVTDDMVERAYAAWPEGTALLRDNLRAALVAALEKKDG